MDPSVSFWESCQASLSKGSLYHSCALYVKSSDPRAHFNPWVRAQKRAGVTSMAFIYCKWRNGSCLWQGNISEGRQRVKKKKKNQTCVSTKLNLHYENTRRGYQSVINMPLSTWRLHLTWRMHDVHVWITCVLVILNCLDTEVLQMTTGNITDRCNYLRTVKPALRNHSKVPAKRSITEQSLGTSWHTEGH